MATNNECFTCRQSNKKKRSSVICTGCSERFCQPHHQEHRQSLEKDFDRLIEQHNVLRQRLFSEHDDQNSAKLNLLKRIDAWEKDMIKNIQATAAASKTRLIDMINEEKKQLKNNFTSMANELQVNQSGNDYVETDLQEWQKQLNDCKQKFEQFLLSNNNFLDISIKPTDFENIISINRSNDIKIRTRLPTSQTRMVINERNITCKHCERYFPKSSGHVEFCSADCSERYTTKYSDDNSDDGGDNGGDGCFHENCVVLLSNGLTKLVKDIRRGDVLRTPDGSEATVTYVVKITCAKGKASMVTFDCGLIITPWHPIRIDGNWKFPRDIRHEKEIECQEMYNFVLDKCHISIINGLECVTLGHNFKGEVIEHPYFGTAKVVDDLYAMDTLNTGFIELLPNSTIRDSKTRLVTGIRRFNENFQMSTLLSC
ncbi:unnamed protein product [Rotaria sp. Silwood2]|nr:unnamed protein product [Rotaria sp. Silwood2]